MKFTRVLFFVCGLILTSSAHGQKYLEKPYKEWTKDEVIKILTDSPWSSQYQSELGLAASSVEQQRRDQANTQLSGRDRGNLGRPAVPIPITIRLHSALLVRQAMVRNQQLGAGYDKMNPEDQKKFDESTAKFLECGICKGYYVVTLTKWKDTSTSVNEGMFASLSLEFLKDKIWLANDKGDKLELAQFTAPKKADDSAVFFFKRADEKGNPFFSENDKEIRFVFANELRDSTNIYRSMLPRSFDFKVAKMVVDNKLVF